MIENIEEKIREYLGGVIHLSLGTVADGKPWVCEVHFAYDDELNLYFVSNRDTRHSTEIRANGSVAGNIVTQHGPGEKPRGVYFEGTAEELDGIDETHPAYQAYHARFGARADILNDEDRAAGLRFYKIAVKTFYLFDTRESKPAKKYELPWKS